MNNTTALQQYRQVPFHRFSPLEPREKLPKGAFVGQLIELNTPDLSAYRVCKNGATALTVDNTNAKLVGASISTGLSGTANIEAAVKQGQARVIVEVEDTDNASKNQFAGGKFDIVGGTGAGESYYIQRNNAKDTSGGTGNHNVTFWLQEKLRKDIATDSNANIINNPCNGVLGTGTESIPIVGANITAVPANYYFLAQVRGIIRLDDDGTGSGAISAHTQIAGGTSGSFQAVVAADIIQTIGHTLQTIADDGQGYCYLDLLS